MRWQARRGVLDPLDASPPGSVWWRAVNERLLRDGCETVALLGGLAGQPSSQAVRLWLEFSARPTGRNWYRAHNASIVGSYLEHRELAEAESAPERFFMNVALARVLYAHALVAAPRLALGRLAPLGRLVGDPRLGMAGVFLSLRRVLPDRYPLDRDVERYIADEQRLGRMLDYAVIVPRLQRLYEWSAQELAEPRLLKLIRDGNPIYAWPFEERHVWRSPHMPFAARALARMTRPPGAGPEIGSKRPPPGGAVPARGIHHIDLAVADIDASLAFYLDLLGPLGLAEEVRYPTYRGTEEVVYLVDAHGGAHEGGLGLRPADGGAHSYYDVGIEHLAFEVESRDEVDAAHERCLARGARIHFPPQEDRDEEGYYAFFVFDPDGIRVEVFCWPRDA